MSMDKYMALHPEMMGEEAFRKADEPVEAFGSQDDKNRIKEMDTLADTLDSLEDSEFENHRKEKLTNQIIEVIKTLEI